MKSSAFHTRVLNTCIMQGCMHLTAWCLGRGFIPCTVLIPFFLFIYTLLSIASVLRSICSLRFTAFPNALPGLSQSLTPSHYLDLRQSSFIPPFAFALLSCAQHPNFYPLHPHNLSKFHQSRRGFTPVSCRYFALVLFANLPLLPTCLLQPPHLHKKTSILICPLSFFSSM